MSKFNPMRRTLLIGTSSSIFLAQFPFTAFAQGPTAVCSRVGQKILFNGKNYICQKVKGKLAWHALTPLKPVVQIHPSPAQPSPAVPSSSPSAKPPVANTPTPSPTQSKVSGFLVTNISNLVNGEVKIFVAKNLQGASVGIALFLSGDVVTAHSVICTHKGCTVGEAGKNLACPCHGSLYNGQSGDVITGPAQKALTAYKVAQVSNEIYIVS